MQRFRAAALLLLLAGCGGNAPAPEPVPVPQPAAPASAPAAAEERATGTVRVNVSTLNIRGDASTSSEIIGHARRGERLTVVGDSSDWLRVKLSDGTTGWV